MKRFIEGRYKDGKRDLYTAFILRCREFAGRGGHVGMVSQQSWMFLRSFAALRKQVLEESAISTIVHLGSRAFEEIGGEVVSVALFTLRNDFPASDHRMTAFRLVGPKSSDEKNRVLLRAIMGSAPTVVSRPRQIDLLSILYTPFVYWLRPRFFQLLAKNPLVGKRFQVGWGVSSSDNDRFLRRFWEVTPSEHWLKHAKGGGYSRWRGMESWLLDWRDDGSPIKDWILERYPYLGKNYEIKIRDHTFFKWGWSYSSMAGKGLSFRLIDPGYTTNAKAPAVFTSDFNPALGAVLNSRLLTYLVRSLSTSLNVDEGYVARLPLPGSDRDELSDVGKACLELKSRLIRQDLTELSFSPPLIVKATTQTPSVLTRILDTAHYESEMSSSLHAIEGINEALLIDAYDLEEEDAQAITGEVGPHVGAWPLIAGYDKAPEAFLEVISGWALGFLEAQQRLDLAPSAIAHLKERLRDLYKAGPGLKIQGEQEEPLDTSALIPPETFVEELAQQLELHPISVYWLIKELTQQEGIVSPPEIKRRLEDYVSASLLLLLGYRWPEQESYEAESELSIDPDLIDEDGIIPLVECGNQPTAAERMHDLLEQRFGEDGATRSEEDFRKWVGRNIEQWLQRDFFTRHLKQFKSRPIVLHLSSAEGTFQAFLLYHKLSRKTLQVLRTRYAGDLIDRLRAEQEKVRGKSEAGVQELESRIEDVQEFRDTLEHIERGDGVRHRIRCRWKGEEDEGRPGPYAPDLDDGVKVNIRPFQEAGLLAKQVIKKW